MEIMVYELLMMFLFGYIQVFVGGKLVSGLHLYLEGSKCNRLEIHLQHLSSLPQDLRICMQILHKLLLGKKCNDLASNVCCQLNV
jgi:hypothetical protein